MNYKPMPFRVSFFSVFTPFLWLLAAAIWIYSQLRFGHKPTYTINIVLALLASILWTIRLFWMKRTPYLEVNSIGLKINLSMVVKRNIFWDKMEQIVINPNKISFISKVTKKKTTIWFKLLEAHDQKFLVTQFEGLHNEQKNKAQSS